MKMTVRIDLAIQTIMMGVYVAMFCIGGLQAALLPGTILMNWQLMSCLLTMFFSTKRRYEYVVFAVAVIVFQVMLNVMFVHAPAWYGLMLIVVSFGLPPVLIIYYYVLTLVFNFRRKNHKGNFLPHTSF